LSCSENISQQANLTRPAEKVFDCAPGEPVARGPPINYSKRPMLNCHKAADQLPQAICHESFYHLPPAKAGGAASQKL
jgi:hypothetical protein